jgi:YegS/Rv2252/BmrU family lipid kinase
VKQRLADSGIHFDVASPSSPSEYIETTRNALLSGVDTIVAAGGDGTVNLVANGFFSGGLPINPQACLGFLPLGTGNDLARTLGIPRGEAAVASLLRPPRWLDVGSATLHYPSGDTESRCFLNFAAIGLPVLVVQKMARRRFCGGGFLSYMVASLSALPEARPIEVELSLGGAQSVRMNLLASGVCNGTYFGGGMRLNPGAIMDDGWFEAMTMQQTRLLRRMLILLQVYFGAHMSQPEIKNCRTQDFRLSSRVPFYVSLDGDPIPDPVDSLAVQVNRRALQVLA